MKQMKDLKRFSPEWWTNYWYYYKIHTIVSVIVIAMIVGTVYEAVTRVKPDVDITIASQYGFTEAFSEKFETRINEIIDDINGDGVKKTQVSILATSTEPKDEMSQAANQKLFLEFSAGDCYLFILDKALFDAYDAQDIFAELKDGIKYYPLNEYEEFANTDLVLCVRHKRNNDKADYTNTQKIIESMVK